MKFYEFNNDNYEIYALIGAETEEKSIEAYKEITIMSEEEKNSHPYIITEDQAMEKYINCDIEGCYTKGEKVKDFYNNINKNPECAILLIDSGIFAI